MYEGQPGGQDGWHQERVNIRVNIPCSSNSGKLCLLKVGGIQKLEMHVGKLCADYRDP